MPFLSPSIPPPPPCQRLKVKHPTEMQKNSPQWVPRVRDVCRNYLCPAPTAHPDFQSLRSRTRPSPSPMAAEMSTLMRPPFDQAWQLSAASRARACSTSHVENPFVGTAPSWKRASATRRAPDSFTISRRHHTCSPIGRTTAWRPLSDQSTE